MHHTKKNSIIPACVLAFVVIAVVVDAGTHRPRVASSGQFPRSSLSAPFKQKSSFSVAVEERALMNNIYIFHAIS